MGLNAGHFAGPLPARIFPSVAVRQKHAAHYNEIRRKCPIVHPESNGSLPVIRPTPWKRSADVRLPEGVRTVRRKAFRAGRHCMHCRQATYQFPAGTARFRQAVSSDDGN